jgi:MFS family permease
LGSRGAAGRVPAAQRRGILRRVPAPDTFLLRRGYLGLLVTQFLGAANDNVLRATLIFMLVGGGLWQHRLGEGSQAIVGLALAVPFILFSGFAGQFADRYAKHRVIIVVKLLEIPIVLLAGIGFWMGNLWVTLAAFTLLATQSAFFGPAKYGIVPELVAIRDLPRANGVLNMMTNIAVIFGMVIAGPVCDAYLPAHLRPVDPFAAGAAGAAGDAATSGASAAPAAPAADAVAAGALNEPLLWLPLVVLLALAICGFASAFIIPRLAPMVPNLPFDSRFFVSYIDAMREMARGPLLSVAFGWGIFSLLGTLALFIIPEYGGLLGVNDTMAAALLGMLGISIGIGSVVAGLASGHRIRPRLVIPGAVGLIVCFTALGVLPPTYLNVASLLFLCGLAAGFYIVPLQSLLQALAPDGERGRFLGAANGISFCFIASSSAIYFLFRNTLAVPAPRIFLVCAALTLISLAMMVLIMLPRLERQEFRGS